MSDNQEMTQETIDNTVAGMIVDTQSEMTDEEFASRTVEMLIYAEGNLNKYKLTLWIMLTLQRHRCAKVAGDYDRQAFPGMEGIVNTTKRDISYRIMKLGAKK